MMTRLRLIQADSGNIIARMKSEVIDSNYVYDMLIEKSDHDVPQIRAKQNSQVILSMGDTSSDTTWAVQRWMMDDTHDNWLDADKLSLIKVKHAFWGYENPPGHVDTWPPLETSGGNYEHDDYWLKPGTKDLVIRFCNDSGGPEYFKRHVPNTLNIGTPYPNPFGTATSFFFNLSESASLTIDVYDILGRRITNLAHSTYEKGDHFVTWDGRNSLGYKEKPGMYFIVVRGYPFYSTTKVILK